MKLREAITEAFETIRKGRGRSVLAMTVTALGMGCMLVMAGLGLGGMGQFQKSISGNDPTEIRVTPGQQGKPALNDAAIESFKKIEGAAGATGVITLPLKLAIAGYEAKNIEAVAVDPAVIRDRLEYEKGGLFNAQGSSPQLILGYGALLDFKNTTADGQDDENSMGDTGTDGEEGQSAEPTPPPIDWLKESLQASIAGEEAGGEGESPDETASETDRLYTGRIAGVLKKDGSERNEKALVSLAVAKKMLQENYEVATSLGLKTEPYASALVYARDIGSAEAVMESISAMGYTAESAVADLTGMQEKLGLQQTLLALIEVFAVLATGLVLAYILLTGAGAQGTGIRASRREASANRQRLLAQSAILGLAGGAMGVLAAYLFTLIVNTSTAETVVFGMHFGQNSNLTIPFWLALMTLAVSAVTGILAGLLPAARASRTGECAD